MSRALILRPQQGLSPWRAHRQQRLISLANEVFARTQDEAARQMVRSAQILDQRVRRALAQGRMTPEKWAFYDNQLERHLAWLEQRVAQISWEIQTILSQ